MYGDHVFRAVLDASETESGISVHLVDPEYDAGTVVRQCRVPIVPGDSLEALKTRIRSRERAFVVETLARIADGRLVLERDANGNDARSRDQA
jgi:phosphoribosylglycinamide formyltransferase-1